MATSTIYRETTAGEVAQAVAERKIQSDQKVFVPEARELTGELVRIPKTQRIDLETGRWVDQ